LALLPFFFFFKGGALSLRAQANEVRKIETKSSRSVFPWMVLSPPIGMLPQRGSATFMPIRRRRSKFFPKNEAPRF
jgi:hypothetical protein